MFNVEHRFSHVRLVLCEYLLDRVKQYLLHTVQFMDYFLMEILRIYHLISIFLCDIYV